MTTKPSRLRSLQTWIVLLSLATPVLTQTSPECTIEGIGVQQWVLGLDIDILDTAVGNTFSGATENTISPTIYLGGEVLNAGPYVNFRMESGNFVAYLLDSFADYEEYENRTELVNNLDFHCHNNLLLVTHHIQDTNNHSPVLQSATTIFVATPIVAGGLVPDIIIVRDVDLTTSSITFEISTNDYFDIQEIAREPSYSKNFRAQLVTKRLITDLNEPVLLTITATDNDETGDPQRRIVFTLTVSSDPEFSVPPSPVFSQAYYRGSYTTATGLVIPDTIVITEGYDDNVDVSLSGDSSSHFTLKDDNGVITLATYTENPISVPVPNDALTFTIVAIRRDEPSIRGIAAVFISVPEEAPTVIILRFERAVYEGTINEGVISVPAISLSEGFSPDVEFNLIDEFKIYFRPAIEGNRVQIELADSNLPDAVTEEPFINLVLEASGDGFVATTTVITLATGTPETTFVRPQFSETFYRGSYGPAGHLDFPEMTLSAGYDVTVEFGLEGDNSAYFEVSSKEGTTVVLELRHGSLPALILETNNELLFEVSATRSGFVASAAIHLSLPRTSGTDLPSLIFGNEYYLGTIANNQLTTPVNVILGDGFNAATGVQFSIEGEYRDHFAHVRYENVLTVTMPAALPADVLTTDARINLVLRATSVSHNPASTVITLLIIPPVTPVFSEVIYTGRYNLNTGLILDNEINLRRGFSDEVSFTLHGDHSRFFEPLNRGNWIDLQLADPITEVVIQTKAFLSFSILASKVGTEGGSAGIIITLSSEESSQEPEIPIPEVTFTSDAFHIRTDPSQTGVIGGVFASASNGELLQYTLNTYDEHLREIVNIGLTNGQVLLMSPANPGVYQAVVKATTTRSGISATADLTITVETVIVCGVDDYALNPLVILERVEEQAADDLFPMHSDLINACRYVILTSWPADQDWFDITENGGLSMAVIDREHPSIAHIHLSQVRVELALICNNDENFASQRKTLSRHLRDVESVDFGNREWIITNEIRYSRRRTSVNVIITDINDNSPIFVVTGNEPLTIGYPDSNALELISPPFFAEVQATDADIGINAQILYSVQNQMFTIHPETGVLYLMPQAMSTLTDGFQFSVTATDENGNGRSTSLNIRVRLLSQSQIATLVINNAFLESEATIIQNLSQRLNVQMRSLAAFVVPKSVSALSNSYYYTASRIFNKTVQRDTPDSPTLTLHVYALDALLDPVAASTLVSLISNLDDDYTGWQISSSIFFGSNEVIVVEESSAGLLAATIALSILVAVLIIGFVGWTIYKIRYNRYKHFSESNSPSSSIAGHPEKRDVLDILPRNNQDLNVGRDIAGPYNSVLCNTITGNKLPQENAPKPIPVAPWINISGEKPELQDDAASVEDEFGESKRRKSVVTFNEYVQQISIEKLSKENRAPLAEFQSF